MDSPNPALVLLTPLFLLLLAYPLFNGPDSARAQQLLPIVKTNFTQVFIVHLQSPRGSPGLLTSEELNDWYFSYLPNTTLDSGEPRMIHTYDYVITGFAARLTDEEAASLESTDGFVFAYPEKNQPLHTTYTPEFLGLNQFNGLWEHSSQGEGVIVAVLDTGILPNHPSFADTLKLPQPPLKWRGRCDLPAESCPQWADHDHKNFCPHDFCSQKNFLQLLLLSSAAVLLRTPIDDTGHGTHVAGIAVGSPVYNVHLNGLARGTAAGMAPSAHLAVYRVCQNNECPDSFSLKGIEKAILDGVDIIQISNGAPNEFHLSGNIKGSFRALQKGILTICSAQNQGPIPSLISNDAPWILTVGAASTGRRNTVVLKLGNGMMFNGESSNQPDPSDNIIDLPLINPVGVNKTHEKTFCLNGSMTDLNITGKIVICRKEFTEPHEKSKVVKEAGGVGIIIVNQKWSGDTLSSYSFAIPGIHVTHKDTLKIRDYTAKTNPTASITFKGTEFGIRPSPSIAAFSSRGPSSINGGILKPDVIAPGVNILSAWPFDAGDGSAKSDDAFHFESGTSMAAPHVSGIAALLKKVHPDWTPAMIKSALMTTAYTEDRDKNRITDDASNRRAPANAFAIGAGHVNPSAAEDPGLVYDTSIEDYMSYLCGLNGMSPRKFIMITSDPSACSNKKKMAAEELNYPSIQVSMGWGGKNKTVPRTVTNVGKANSIYMVTVVEPNGVKVDVNPKTLEFDSIGEEKKFTVEISLTGSPPAGQREAWEGRLVWVSGKYQVASPIVVIE
ncbi:Subtilisin-like protease [Platanthera zijinensis]|uniref:Subtilisin-like protease n=1 Tax=Platanthera zijinensis TaxID=2320716 RepID=A0AAP0G8W1_9ASPA